MKMKKISLIITVILFSLIFTGCPDCLPEIFYYGLTDVKLQNIDNAGERPVIIENENQTILKEAFGIRLTLNLELISDSINNRCCKNNFFNNISLFNNLYAFTDGCYTDYILKDTITSINVFTLNDFDNDFTVGADVSELFKIYSSKKYISIDEYLKNYRISFYPNSYYQSDKNAKSEIDLYLLKPPTFTGEHSFRIEVLLSDGKVFSAATPRINLK